MVINTTLGLKQVGNNVMGIQSNQTEGSKLMIVTYWINNTGLRQVSFKTGKG